MRRAVHAALWRGLWGKATAMIVALAAIAPAAPAEVSAGLHGMFPWLPLWVPQLLAAAVLIARLTMAQKIVAGSETEVERRRRG